MTPQALAVLHAAAFRNTRAWSAEEFAKLLAQAGTRAIGNEDCFILVRTVLDEAEVLTIATHPQKRRRGLARQALETAEAAVVAEGARAIFLEVAEDNTAAIGLYITAGYARIGRRPNYYLPKDGAPVAALVLRKSLGPI